MKNKWLRGDNSVNIQGRIMVRVHCPSSYFHLSINQVSFQSRTLQDMAWTGIQYEKWLRGDNSINIQGRIIVLGFCPSPHCLMFHLNANSSFKVTHRTDRQSYDYMRPPLGSIIK